MSSVDPLHQVRTSSARVMETASHVSIVASEVDKVAQELFDSDFAATINGVQWDSSGWHYSADAEACGPLTAQYVFVMDALNFCFWPCEGLEYDTLATGLKKTLERDPNALSAENLSNLTEDGLLSWFDGRAFPEPAERVLRMRELGEVLARDFDGLAYNIVLAAKGSTSRLAELIISKFQGFRDTSVYKGRLVHFYKRAQILIGDLWAAYGKPQPGHPLYLDGIDQLTMFADYRVPQLLRVMGVMQYDEPLAALVDSKAEIPFGSEMEIEIRAATVVAVEQLHHKLVQLGVNLLVIELDWLLWQRGETMKDSLKPHHRTRTIYY